MRTQGVGAEQGGEFVEESCGGGSWFVERL